MFDEKGDSADYSLEGIMDLVGLLDIIHELDVRDLSKLVFIQEADKSLNISLASGVADLVENTLEWVSLNHSFIGDVFVLEELKHLFFVVRENVLVELLIDLITEVNSSELFAS